MDPQIASLCIDNLINKTVQIALLQCTSAYPCQPRDTALRVMDAYTAAFPHVQVMYYLATHFS